MSESENFVTTADLGAQENNDEENSDQQLDTAREKGEEEHRKAEKWPGPEHQPEVLEDFTEAHTELGDEGNPVKDVTKAGVAGVSVSKPGSHDEETSTPLPPSKMPLLPPPAAAMLFAGDGSPVAVIRVTCGARMAEFHVDRLADGLGPVTNSIGTSRTSLCVRTFDDDDDGIWMTPNQFQRASGRGTARDWKRSIKHHGVSLKSLLTKAILSFDAACPGCRCNMCTVSVFVKQPDLVFTVFCQ